MSFTLAENDGDNMLDVRDIIERVEELESNLGDPEFQGSFGESAQDMETELATLTAFLETLKGNGGDEQWRGDWYPVTLIRDSYFEDYAEELADDIGAIDSNQSWPLNCIDWKQAADELKQDYTSVELENVTYWAR